MIGDSMLGKNFNFKLSDELPQSLLTIYCVIDSE